MLKIINSIQSDEHVSTVHRSGTHGLMKTVLAFRNILIQLTK